VAKKVRRNLRTILAKATQQKRGTLRYELKFVYIIYFIALLILNPYPPKESMAGQSFRQVLIPTVHNPPKDSTPML
jgi:hypothetical protein